MEKVPGCWEHMSMVWSALKDARSDKLDLATIWLDIANGYGSIPHRVIFFALERYGVPQHWISFIKNYYVGIYSKSFSDHGPSNWHKNMRGIFSGCTLSIILFLAGINIILEYTLLSSAHSIVTQYCHSQGKVIELYPFLCEETIRSNILFFLHPFYSLSANEILRPYYRCFHLR